MRRRALPLLTVLLLASAPAWGQPSKRDEIDRVEAERRDKEKERDTLKAQAAQTTREVEALRARLVDLAKAQSGRERRVASQRARFEALNARESALTMHLSANRGQLTRLLGALQLYSRNPPPALLVSPRSANDAVRAAILMKAITPELERRAADLAKESAEIQRLRREAALAGETLFTTESEVADRRAEIERLIADKRTLEAKLTTDADAADRQARALAQRSADLRGLVQGLAQTRPAAPDPALPDPERGGMLSGKLRLVRPVQGTLLRKFGALTPSGGKSEGLAWRTEPSAQVLAPADGRVEYAGPLKGWDQVIVLRLGGGYHMVLAGLSDTTASTGHSVAAGEPIGSMGNARNPAPELYLEMRKDGAPTDPARWLDASAAD